MPLLAQTLAVAALGTSARNRSGLLTDATSEILGVLQRLGTDLFLDASVAAPFSIGAFEIVPYSATVGGWLRPANALSILRLEAVGPSGSAPTVPSIADGTVVRIVHPDDRRAGALEPHVIELGVSLLPSGETGSPTGGGLRCFYARRMANLNLLGTLNQPLDPAFPDEMMDYFVAGLAEYFALKDQRLDEMPAHGARKTEMRTLWARYLMAQTPALSKTFFPRPALPVATEPRA